MESGGAAFAIPKGTESAATTVSAKWASRILPEAAIILGPDALDSSRVL
jgi:hypothetical protein